MADVRRCSSDEEGIASDSLRNPLLLVPWADEAQEVRWLHRSLLTSTLAALFTPPALRAEVTVVRSDRRYELVNLMHQLVHLPVIAHIR